MVRLSVRFMAVAIAVAFTAAVRVHGTEATAARRKAATLANDGVQGLEISWTAIVLMVVGVGYLIASHFQSRDTTTDIDTSPDSGTET